MSEPTTAGADVAQVAPAGLTFGTFNFADLNAAPAAEARGFRLIDQSALESVPFVIVGIHLRDGIKRPGPDGPIPTNYLSVECVTADAATLAKCSARNSIVQDGHIITDVNALKVDANEMVVFNDGSTGVARQLVSFLHGSGRIVVTRGETTPNGEMGQSTFDMWVGDWADLNPQNVTPFDPENPAYFGMPLLKCPRGLRKSEYTVETLRSEATTWYIG